MTQHPACALPARAFLGLALAMALGGAHAAAPKPAKAAPAAAPVVALTPDQLAAAERVFTGHAQCDQGHAVDLAAVDGKPGHFKLQFNKKASYVLTPEVTETGAVRLEDKKAGIVWLQIPAKSMLMNAKLGQRVADGCKMAQQAA